MATEFSDFCQIITLSEDHGDAAASLMARALHDDPLFVRGCLDPDLRARWLPWLFRWSTWKGFYFGRTLGTAGELTGVAALIGPDGGDFTPEQLAQFDYAAGRDAIGAAEWDRAVDRVNAAFDPADTALHQTCSEAHWYLDVLAVAPACQGQGMGGTLLRAVHELADADGKPTVLLTFNPRNHALYERHHYRVICHDATPTHGPAWWGMQRDPG